MVMRRNGGVTTGLARLSRGARTPLPPWEHHGNAMGTLSMGMSTMGHNIIVKLGEVRLLLTSPLYLVLRSNMMLRFSHCLALAAVFTAATASPLTAHATGSLAAVEPGAFGRHEEGRAAAHSARGSRGGVRPRRSHVPAENLAYHLNMRCSFS